MIDQKFYDAAGREFMCMDEGHRWILVRHRSGHYKWPFDVELWKRKLTDTRSGEQFYTEAQNLVRHRAEINKQRLLDHVATLDPAQVDKAEINKQRLLDHVATLDPAQVDKVLAMLFQPVK